MHQLMLNQTENTIDRNERLRERESEYLDNRDNK